MGTTNSISEGSDEEKKYEVNSSVAILS